jgi:hypothetical protein
LANGRSGSVFLEHFDLGVATTLGGELVNVVLDGEQVQTYAVRISGVNGPGEYNGLVPIVMSEPDETYQSAHLPEIVITRSSAVQQMNRWFPGGHEYQVAASNSQQVAGPGGRMMPNRIEKKLWTYPFEISYDIQLRSRLRIDADRMLRHAGARFWAYGQVFLIDSEGDERGYHAFVDTFDPLSELTDISDRLQGHIISLRVEGELDFAEPFLAPTSPTLRTNVIAGTKP